MNSLASAASSCFAPFLVECSVSAEAVFFFLIKTFGNEHSLYYPEMKFIANIIYLHN